MLEHVKYTCKCGSIQEICQVHRYDAIARSINPKACESYWKKRDLAYFVEKAKKQEEYYFSNNKDPNIMKISRISGWWSKWTKEEKLYLAFWIIFFYVLTGMIVQDRQALHTFLEIILWPFLS